MAFHNDQDLPAELLKKLESLQLELEDGDITQKGYDKKRTNLLEQHSQKKKEEEEALLASLGPEPSAADVVDFLDYLPSPTHSPPRPTSGEQHMEQNHQLQQQQQQQQQQQAMGYSDGSSATISTTRTSSIGTHQGQNRYPGYDSYQQVTPPVQQSWQQQQQQQQQISSYGQPQQSPVGYAPENTMISGQYYPAVTGSPRPNRPYDPRVARPQYTQPQPSPYYTSQQPQPQQHTTSSIRPLPSTPMYQQSQQQQQQRPTMPFPGTSYPQQQPPTPLQRPVYSNQPRPMYRPPPMMNGGMQRPPGNGGGPYYRPSPNAPPPPPQGSGYPLHGRSPTLDHQRTYGYTGGVSRSSTQNSSQGRYS